MRERIKNKLNDYVVAKNDGDVKMQKTKGLELLGLIKLYLSETTDEDALIFCSSIYINL